MGLGFVMIFYPDRVFVGGTRSPRARLQIGGNVRFGCGQGLDAPAERPRELFYRPAGTADFSEENSAKMPISGRAQAEFRVSSADGFADRLRLDPVFQPAPVVLGQLSVHCLDERS